MTLGIMNDGTDFSKIDDKTYQAALNTPLTAAYHGPIVPVHAPYVAEMVRNMMVTSFADEAYTKGYKELSSLEGGLIAASLSNYKTNDYSGESDSKCEREDSNTRSNRRVVFRDLEIERYIIEE